MTTRTPRQSWSAFTLVEIMIVVAIIGLLAAIAIPNFVKARMRSQTNGCINNLRMIDASKQQWALENRMVGSSTPTITDLGPYLIRGTTTRLPYCPAAGATTDFGDSYIINQVTNPPTCQIAPGPGEHVLPQ